jgi:hypothetical protein
LDLGEGVQLLCHVQALILYEIPGTELQKGNQHAALIPQMLIEGESPQVGLDHPTGLISMLGIGMTEPTQRLHFLLQRVLQFFDQCQKEVQS